MAGARILRDGERMRIGGTRLRVVDPEERYLRQMRSVEVAVPAGDPVLLAGSSRDPASTRVDSLSSTSRPSRLPLVASAIAITTLCLALGLVLALAFFF